MDDYSRSHFWDKVEEAPDQNWKQEAMESRIHRYLSGPESTLSPHPPYSPTPDDDPIHQHFFLSLPFTRDLNIIIDLIWII